MSGSFVFERDEKMGQMVFCDFPFSAAWFDPLTGVLYVASGEDGDIYQWDDLTQPPFTLEWKSKVITTKDYINLSAARVVADYGSAIAIAPASLNWEDANVQWDTTVLSWSSTDTLTFKLWADKELIFTTELTSSDIFRLPTGYRSDTFEFSVEGNIRVRAVHLSETVLGLKKA